MWRIANGDELREQIAASRSLMADTLAFKAAMQSAVHQWPYSTEHNLTARVVNRRAWLGHAGCFLAAGSVEASTRRAWNLLTDEQRTAGDHAAQKVINEWEARYAEKAS